jgi:hypothetical protein
MRSMILDLPYTGNFRLDPSVPLEGYKWSKSELWKRGEEFKFERKVALEKLFTSY